MFSKVGQIHHFRVVTPDCHFDDSAIQAVRLAAERLRDAGHTVEPAKTLLTPADWQTPREVYLAQVCANAAADFLGRDIPDELEPMNRATIEMGRLMQADAYLRSVRRGHDFARRFAEIWNRFDVLLMPALAGAAPKLGLFPMDHEDVALHVNRMTRLAPFAGTFNLTGGPALVIGVSQTATGLPLAVQLSGDIGDDPQLLALGEELLSV